ncbi:hypothetical protein ACFL35_22070 [Candidatus Riflebacteria bacterium]
MAIKIINRISKKEIIPHRKLFFGEAILVHDEENSNLHNSFHAENISFLVPDKNLRWDIDYVAKAFQQGEFFPTPFPSDRYLNALEIFHSGLGSMDSDLNFQNWCDYDALSSTDVKNEVKEKPLVREIQRDIGHLVTVFNNPCTHIKLESERILVGKSRRLDKKASQTLVSRTEDWGQRKISGIQPKRILSLVREELWDLYENRVAVQLSRDLIKWLRDEISSLNQIREMMKSSSERHKGEGMRWHKKEKRMYQIWGDSFSSDNSGQVLESLIHKLKSFLKKTLGLLDRKLIKKIPRRVELTHSLKMTNLLINDDHYRGVGRLWKNLKKNVTKKNKSPKELFKNYQALNNSFLSWVFLITLKSMAQLNYKHLNEGIEFNLEEEVSLLFPNNLKIEKNEMGEILLKENNKTILRVLAIFHAFENIDNQEIHPKIRKSFEKMVAGERYWTLVIHPSVSKNNGTFFSHIHNPPFLGNSCLDFIGMSPYALDNVEKLARAIRWAIFSKKYLEYPFEISTEFKELFPTRKNWFRLRE